MTAAREAILRLFRSSEIRAVAVVTKDAMSSGHAPLVGTTGDGERESVLMLWGACCLSLKERRVS
jgi:hypothetical protein